MANVDIVPCDISVAGRVLAAFPDFLEESQRLPDNLAYLGEQCMYIILYINNRKKRGGPCVEVGGEKIMSCVWGEKREWKETERERQFLWFLV